MNSAYQSDTRQGVVKRNLNDAGAASHYLIQEDENREAAGSDDNLSTTNHGSLDPRADAENNNSDEGLLSGKKVSHTISNLFF